MTRPDAVSYSVTDNWTPSAHSGVPSTTHNWTPSARSAVLCGIFSRRSN